MNKKTGAFLALLFCLWSCQDTGPVTEIYVYANDFETTDYTGIKGVFISEFDGTKLMGNFNNSGFNLELDNLPEHDYIRVFFDLYIHDSWDGNSNELEGDQINHDAWIIEFDSALVTNPSEKILFETTFSNKLCIPGWCTGQSYPNEFPFHNEAREGAKRRTTFGWCLWRDNNIGTSIYRIDKIFPHDRTSTVISFYDRLIQTESFSAKCDESWSLDNIGVSVFTTER